MSRRARTSYPKYQVKSASRTSATIICGPPGSGKTTYAMEHRSEGDLIVDIDALYAALSGLGWYNKPKSLLPFVCEARDAIINRLARASEVKHAWIVTAEPDTRKLRALRERLNAEVIVLDVEPDECLRRIAADPRRSDKDYPWRELIDDWWLNYEGEDL